MGIGEFFRKMLSSSDEVSSKRFIGLISFFSLLIIVFTDLYTDYSVSPNLVDALVWIIIGAFFTGALEYYSRKSGQPQQVNVQQADTVKVNTKDAVTNNPPAKPQPQPVMETDDFDKEGEETQE